MGFGVENGRGESRRGGGDLFAFIACDGQIYMAVHIYLYHMRFRVPERLAQETIGG